MQVFGKATERGKLTKPVSRRCATLVRKNLLTMDEKTLNACEEKLLILEIQ